MSVPTADGNWTFQLSEGSARHVRDGMANIGAVITGRRTFDIAGGWGGQHPMGVPAFVVTHAAPHDWPGGTAVAFVTDGIESAVARAKAAAGGKAVVVASPTIAQQVLDCGLLDEVVVSLVPVLLGEGVRFFDNLARTPIELEGPRIIEGRGVTHLYYRVRHCGGNEADA